jgi:hypothetical protein
MRSLPKRPSLRAEIVPTEVQERETEEEESRNRVDGSGCVVLEKRFGCTAADFLELATSLCKIVLFLGQCTQRLHI